jgi:hypothetical protein
MLILGFVFCLVGTVLIDANIEVFKTNWAGAVGYILVVVGAGLIATAIG